MAILGWRLQTCALPPWSKCNARRCWCKKNLPLVIHLLVMIHVCDNDNCLPTQTLEMLCSGPRLCILATNQLFENGWNGGCHVLRGAGLRDTDCNSIDIHFNMVHCLVN
jgi:hypothetical protein